ncbi:transcription factor TFIIIB subunit brf1 [Tulasnella sp. 424]|nr:transcription factor TFIIIB subunit brf1 [Tulasnella sp. 424]KAG8974655.1 transcription factor TFIIIB subunit brf1 [Tulasnella sp. 425]
MSQCLCPNGPTLFHSGSGGDSTCIQCGVVVAENALVSEVSFGETSGGAAIAHGTLVAEGSTYARTGGGRRGGQESSEQAIYNGRIRIAQVGTAMNIPDTIRDSALRYYKLAVSASFTKGRQSRLVVAACLYAACQNAQFGYMLIDFSDVLQINVFVLGATYLKLIQVLHLPRPYAIDPAHYIARFAALLEFGDETPKVAHDAVRLVRRFSADWMNTGRRPAGICGACLLLAARMNNFRRSVQEIVQVVKIADATLVKRLEEFKSTGSSNLTVTQFRDDQHWLPEEMEAPPIIKKQERQKERRDKRRKRKQEEADGDEERSGSVDADGEGDVESAMGSSGKGDTGSRNASPQDHLASPPIDESTPHAINFSAGIFRGVGLQEEDIHPPEQGASTTARPPGQRPLFLLDEAEADQEDRVDETAEANTMFYPPEGDQDMAIDPALYDEYANKEDDPDAGGGGAEIAEEVEGVLHGEAGLEVSAELEQAEADQRQKKKQKELEDKLDDLDEDELDQFILTDEEVRLKTRVWVELNRDYLEKLAAKGLDEAEGDQSRKPPKQKKQKQKPRDSTTARGATPAESVGHLLQKKKFSRKINYDAIKNLFKSSSDRPSKKSKSYGLDDSLVGFDNDEDKDDEAGGGMSTIDPDPDFEGTSEVHTEKGYASGYSGGGDGDDSMYANDDYYDDGGYQEEV